MLTLTPSAVEAVDQLLHSNPQVPEDAGLRIAAGAQEHELTVGLAPSPEPGDQVIEDGGARVFVDPQAAQLLDDAQLEARTEGDQVAFGLAPQSTGDPAPEAGEPGRNGSGG